MQIKSYIYNIIINNIMSSIDTKQIVIGKSFVKGTSKHTSTEKKIDRNQCRPDCVGQTFLSSEMQFLQINAQA